MVDVHGEGGAGAPPGETFRGEQESERVRPAREGDGEPIAGGQRRAFGEEPFEDRVEMARHGGWWR